MDRKSPFDFDIRASSDKKKRTRGRRGMSGAWETSVRNCEHPGCEEAGQYRCPKSPDQLNEYLWFCKDHAREYNLKWNYFDGQSEAEMLDAMERDRVWGRATQPLGSKDERLAWQRLGIEDPHQVLGDKATRNPGRPTSGAASRKLPPTERRALEILDARDTWTRPEIRKQYKSLVKDLHPDRNAGARTDEDRLQEVVWAWDQIKESRNFRD
ncbi:J domain-containing protein [Roseinatronobacter alkalisoli]|uniref:J domain-containing protein n=1 Tax=Roseinatronobacter alkalisoli TaxID=3028235 RepID=A0ABT5TE71_9RHOB|nr:J domain-containing protein [Roseinatronobacter sp. HJB301]MDD7973311.1 J domain-containing protein [Roseinatronobacter sp. HJB301]